MSQLAGTKWKDVHEVFSARATIYHFYGGLFFRSNGELEVKIFKENLFTGDTVVFENYIYGEWTIPQTGIVEITNTTGRNDNSMTEGLHDAWISSDESQLMLVNQRQPTSEDENWWRTKELTKY